jgi:predicted anti-sigma-YlaC factor YlaD
VGGIVALGVKVGVSVGGNHWVGVGSSVSDGSTVLSIASTVGVSVSVAVGVTLAALEPGFNTSIESPMQ